MAVAVGNPPLFLDSKKRRLAAYGGFVRVVCAQALSHLELAKLAHFYLEKFNSKASPRGFAER